MHETLKSQIAVATKTPQAGRRSATRSGSDALLNFQSMAKESPIVQEALQLQEDANSTMDADDTAPVIQRLATISGTRDYPDEGVLEINFREPAEFFGGVTGYVKFTPQVDGHEATAIDLVQTASMKHLDNPERDVEWEDPRPGQAKPTVAFGSDPMFGKNVDTSGGSVIKDAMRTGRVDDPRTAADFHIDKVYDAPRTLPGGADHGFVLNPAYNADRRQRRGDETELGHVRLGDGETLRPRTLPGKNKDGEIEPTTLIDTPRSPTLPVLAEFETVVVADGTTAGSVSWGFQTEFNMLMGGSEVTDSYREFNDSATPEFRQALRNYDSIVGHPDGRTSMQEINYLSGIRDEEKYDRRYKDTIAEFIWALGKLTTAVEKTQAEREKREQGDAALAYLRKIIENADYAAGKLEVPPGSEALHRELIAAVATATDVARS